MAGQPSRIACGMMLLCLLVGSGGRAQTPPSASIQWQPVDWAQPGAEGIEVQGLRVWLDGFVMLVRDAAGVKVVRLSPQAVPTSPPVKLDVEPNARVTMFDGKLYVGDVEQEKAARVSIWNLDGTAELTPLWIKEFRQSLDLKVEVWMAADKQLYATVQRTDMAAEQVVHHFHIEPVKKAVRELGSPPARLSGILQLQHQRVALFEVDRLPDWFAGFERAVRLLSFSGMEMATAASAGRQVYVFAWDPEGLVIRPMKAPAATLEDLRRISSGETCAGSLVVAAAGAPGGLVAWRCKAEGSQLALRAFRQTMQFGELQRIELRESIKAIRIAARSEGMVIVVTAGTGSDQRLYVQAWPYL